MYHRKSEAHLALYLSESTVVNFLYSLTFRYTKQTNIHTNHKHFLKNKNIIQCKHLTIVLLLWHNVTLRTHTPPS